MTNMTVYRTTVYSWVSGEWEDLSKEQYVGTYSSLGVALDALRRFRGKNQWIIEETAVKAACECMGDDYGWWFGGTYEFCVDDQGNRGIDSGDLPGKYCHRYCIEEIHVSDTPETTDDKED